VTRKVVFSPEAEADLNSLFDHIAESAGSARALVYSERIARFCMNLSNFSERGVRRDDLRVGLRTIGFERRVTIAFHVTPDTVTIDRMLYGGRDLGGNLRAK
jgi:toxin ParE1/3/4